MLNTQTGIQGGAAVAKNKNEFPAIHEFEAESVFAGKPFDGLYFRKGKVPEQNTYSYDFVKFKEQQITEHSDDLDSDKWLILLFEESNKDDEVTIVYFQGYLGDPLGFAKNQSKAGSQGLVIKKSPSGFKILLKLVKGLKSLDDLQHIVKEDYADFVLSKVK